MTGPIRVGLMYSNQGGWVGGSYYLLNLISALKRLESQDRPALTVFAFSEQELDQVRVLEYPEAKYRVLHEPQPGLVVRLLNRVSNTLIGRPVRPPPAIKDELDVIYPVGLHERNRNIPRWLFWIPDFQEEHLPEMFGDEKVKNRRRIRGRIAQTARHIVFSSQSAADDFRRFYPHSAAKVHILRFAVTHPIYENLDIEDLRTKFELGDAPFFLVSNQFWKHKNHPLVIRALKHLVDSCTDREFMVCFSGKENDPRNPDYVAGVRAMVDELQLKDRVRFLGFIERAEQLSLMKASIAVIQPSLFEGWSTVVEDAKALSIPVLASDLLVHREQLWADGVFFGTNDAVALSDAMAAKLDQGKARTDAYWDYDERVLAFGRQFVRILNRVTKKPNAPGDTVVLQREQRRIG